MGQHFVCVYGKSFEMIRIYVTKICYHIVCCAGVSFKLTSVALSCVKARTDVQAALWRLSYKLIRIGQLWMEYLGLFSPCLNMHLKWQGKVRLQQTCLVKDSLCASVFQHWWQHLPIISPNFITCTFLNVTHHVWEWARWTTLELKTSVLTLRVNAGQLALWSSMMWREISECARTVFDVSLIH